MPDTLRALRRIAIPTILLMCACAAAGQGIAFQPPLTLNVPGAIAPSPVQVAIADINGDGVSDIITLNRGNATVTTFFGNGKGQFPNSVSFALPASPQSFVVADFDHDGRPDLAVSFVSQPGIALLFGVGDGTFNNGPSMPVGSGAGYRLAVADFNSDGFLDIAGADPVNNRLVVVLGQAGGAFTLPRTFSTGFSPSSIAVMDFDLDGLPDIAIANQSDGNGSLFRGDGKGNFTEITSFRQFASLPNVTNVVNADFTNDGVDDLAYVDNGNITVLLNRYDAPGNFTTPISFPVQGSGLGSLAIGDFDGDGYPDFAVPVGGSSQVQIFSGAFLGSSPAGSPSAPFTLATDKNPQYIALADLNGDGRTDIIVANAGSNTVGVYLNASPNKIVPQTGWWWDPTLSGTGFFVETGGISGNGMFIGGFLYDATGKNTWLVSTGQMSGTNYTNNWLLVNGGQTLTGPYQPPLGNSPVGPIKLTFVDASHAVMLRPNNSTVKLHRFSFTANLSPAAPVAGAPQTGWWWAGQSRTGTGYGIEIQGTSVFIVAYVYDLNGNPVWYLATGSLTTPLSYSGTWYQYQNGPQLTSPEGRYSAQQLTVGSVAMSLTFSDSTHGTLTMGNTVIPIVRFLQY